MRRLSLLLLLSLLAPTLASAGWRDHGQEEPGPSDTPDRMWGEPRGERLFLNAYPVDAATRVNPASATLGVALAPPARSFEAVFGLWLDCNGDGAIGLSDHGLLRYPAALLDEEGRARCVGGHVAGDAVVELLPLTEEDGSRVWGDRAREPSWDCRAWPFPQGATTSTGGLARYADCRLGGALPDGSVPNAPVAHPFRDELEPGVSVDPAPRDRNDAVLRSAGDAWTTPRIALAPQAPYSRETLAPAQPERWTFYARAGPALDAAVFPGGGATFVYGAEHCPAGPEAWECDPARCGSWLTTPLDPLDQPVGSPYHLRDVDCLDVAPVWATRCP